MTENDVNPPINNDPVEKRNEFIDHPSYLCFMLKKITTLAENKHLLVANTCLHI